MVWWAVMEVPNKPIVSMCTALPAPGQCLSSLPHKHQFTGVKEKWGSKASPASPTSFSNQELVRWNSQVMVGNRQHLVLFGRMDQHGMNTASLLLLLSSLQMHAKLSCLQIQALYRGSQYMLETETQPCDSYPTWREKKIQQIKM